MVLLVLAIIVAPNGSAPYEGVLLILAIMAAPSGQYLKW